MTLNLDATHDTPNVICVHCAHVMTNTSGHEVGPEPGDMTLCINCGGLNIFASDLSLRKPTKREAREATADDEVQDIHAAIMRAKAEVAKIN
jgi:hypothetical protein